VIEAGEIGAGMSIIDRVLRHLGTAIDRLDPDEARAQQQELTAAQERLRALEVEKRRLQREAEYQRGRAEWDARRRGN
jgi:hypothetical protein